MSLKIDRVQLEILVQQDSARQQMMQLETQMKSANKELSKIKKQFGENSAEYKAQMDVVKKLKQQYDDLFDSIGIGHLSLKELANRQRELNTILRNMDPSLPEWKEYNKQLQDVNNRIKELKGQAKDTSFSLSKLADGFNRYAAMGASVIASLTGMVLTGRKCVDEFAEMQEAEAGVIKYTGMTADEVADLNEEFKKMDTRTPREKLNALAADAGRLGITGKQDIMDFVDAANTINVALGEDLGEDAVKNIGKLAQMFGEDETKGLRGAMLATGSAVNEVAQKSAASESFLVDFTARVAGVGNQAGLSQADIIGFAASMDENMMRAETSATAYQKILMKMFTDTETFANVAGLEVGEFTRLVREDANEAMLTFAKALSSKGGMADLAPIFGDLKTEGAGVAAVLSLMAGKADQIRERQRLANEAYEEGVSVIKEMNVQNNTVQAGLDKAKNRFKEIRVELGEQLLPVMKYMVSTGSLTVKGLSAIVSFLIKYKTEIIYATLALTTYTAAVNANTIASKATAIATKAATVATNLFNKAMKASPWGLAVAGAGALLGFLVKIKKEQNSISESTKSLNRIQEEANESYAKQAGRAQLLASMIQNENHEQEKRKKYIEELKTILPGYNGMIDREGKLIGHNKEQLEEYLKVLERKIKTKAAETELEELYTKQREKQKQLEKEEEQERKAKVNLATAEFVANNRAGRASTSGTKSLMGGLDQSVQTATNEYNKAAKAVEKTKNELVDIATAINDVNDEIKKSAVVTEELQNVTEGSSTSTTSGGSTSNTTPTETADPKKEQREWIRARQEFNDTINEMERNAAKQRLLDGSMSEEEYQEEIYRLEMEALNQRKALLESFGVDTTDIQGQIYDKMIDETNRRNEATKKAEEEAAKSKKEAKKKAFEEVDEAENFKEEEALLKAMLDSNLITYEEYQDEMTRVAEEKSKQREEITMASLQVMSEAAGALSEVVGAMQDIETRKVESKYDKMIAAAKKAGKDTTKLEEEKEAAVNAVKKKYADKQFAATVLQVTATTAVTAMEAYKAMAGIPIVGPALGAIASAAAIAAGAAQIAIAKQSRDEAKGLYRGGYSDEYQEGYTASGNPRDVAGVIPVHKNEFVANHYAVGNPHVKQFLDVFDIAQKNGSIRMLNTTQILERIRTMGGHYNGGFSGQNSGGTSFISASGAPEQRLQVVQLLAESNRLLGILCEKELRVDPRQVRDSIKKMEALEKNVTRG